MAESKPEENCALLEKQLRQKTAQLEAVTKEFEQFSHSVSHDLRAPLRALEGFAQILVEDHGPKLDAEGRRCVDILAASAHKATLLLEDLLLLSRLFRKPYAPKPAVMKDIVAQRAEELRAEAGPAQIKVGALPDSCVDGDLVGQLWTILLENAIKFSRAQPAPVIEVFGREEPERIVYGVRDNGIGFDPKYIGRLFGVFQRLNGDAEYPGRGIGLAMARRIVVRHGGEIWAEGQAGKGATFSFALPKPG
ncbi:MAG TPA: ATP-binding protein [Verrucomicrobiae bacterium]|jgi:light-regulated signal transduction histidine kinase (bacteriophytochrome)|nr:ATP-binding protein [Verrucomicrobiae bacterium]